VKKIFLAAQKKIIEDFSCPIVSDRLESIDCCLDTASSLSRNLRQDNYRDTTRIPAYYDPNNHTVFLNRSCLAFTPEKIIFVICYHELVHGASLHVNYDLPGVSVFQSGIKFERYHKRNYRCFNRLLNEGIVQFLTVDNNQLSVQDYAYVKEVMIVQELVHQLGLTVVKKALLYEQYTQLKTRFEERFGPSSFTTFTQDIDQKQYHKAYHFLKTTEQVMPYSFQRPVLAAATTSQASFS